ncbi:MAG: LacI family DNA-binding transcriptional regulator [Sedimentisphaeraceae bacterium JB056]
MAKVKNNKRVSILDIAAYVGISKTTVGYVLSGQAEERRVSKKTAEKVLAAADELNYVPHMWARNLARKSTKVIGLIVAGYEYDWATQVTNGVVPVLENKGYMPMTSIHLWDPQRSEREIAISQQRREDGIICQPLPDCIESYKKVITNGTPLLFISDTLEQMPDVSYVAWDSISAAKVAVEHLIQTGRRRIGFIGSSLVDLKYTKKRYLAYREMLEQASLDVDPAWIRWSNLSELVRRKVVLGADESSSENNIRQLMTDIFENSSEKPDAFFFPHDSLALQVYKVLLKMGIKVPDDIALVGMGDVPLSDDFGAGLTTVKEPLEQIGKVAAETMLKLIKNPKSKPIQRLISGNELKIRRSSVVQ